MVLAFPTRKDAGELLALARGSRAFHRGLASPPTTAAAVAAWLRRARTPANLELLVRRTADHRILGAVQVSHIARGSFQSAYLGYWIGVEFARQGYMTEALALVLAYAFGALRLHRLEANLQPGNPASRRLVARLGFRQEGYSPRYLKIGGRWRDHERWAILADDWRPARRHSR